MNGRQLKEYAEEYFNNPEEIIDEILFTLIEENGWSYHTTFEEAVQTHSKALENKLKDARRKRTYG